MKTNLKSILSVVVVVIVVVLMSLLPKGETSNFLTAGGGKSLKEINENEKKTLIMAADVNQTTDGQTLYQSAIIADYHKDFNDKFYAGISAVGCISSEFGICCPYLHMQTGVNLEKWNFEYKLGNYVRNSILPSGIDPQFSNYIIMNGVKSGTSNGMQMSSTFKTTGTTIAIGQNGASDFSKLDGCLYASVCQKLGSFEVLGGIDFTEEPTGYFGGRWSDSKNSVTVSGSSLGSDISNYIASYSRVLSDDVSLTAAAFSSSQEQKLHMVGSWNCLKGLTTFAQLGCSSSFGSYLPYGGIGCSYIF